jgi:hypothetical protein
MLSYVAGSRKKWLSMAATEHGSSPRDKPTVLVCVWIKIKEEDMWSGVPGLTLSDQFTGYRGD